MELAEGQRGDNAETEAQQHAHAQGSRGAEGNQNTSPGLSIEKVLSDLSAKMNVFSKATKDIKTLAQAVSTLREDVKSLKRKSQGEEEDQPAPKKTCSGSKNDSYLHSMSSPPNPDASPQPSSESEDSEDELLDSFMDSSNTELSPPDDLEELEEFFQIEDGTGEEVSEQMARISEKALRGTRSKKEDEKLQALKEKHLRPKNIKNLQIPKVDEALWRQMKREVKTVDYLQQKAIANYGQALIPTIKALECLQGNKQPKQASEHIMDTFKILTLNIKLTNANRTERIKKELQPTYRALCQNEASATHLLGDNFQEAVKKLEGTKGNLTLMPQHFLGKKRGDKYRQSSHRNNQYYGQGYKPGHKKFNNNNPNYNQHHKNQGQYRKRNQQGNKK